MRRIAGLLLIALLLNNGHAAGAQTGTPPSLPAHLGQWGLELSDRDPSVRPGDDFFMSQNGAWFAHAEILPEAPAAAYWRDLRIATPFQLKAIFDELSTQGTLEPGTPEALALAFYQSYMDAAAVEQLGVTPLDTELREVRNARTRSAMARLMGRTEGPESQRDPTLIQPIGRGFFRLNIQQDQNDPARYSVYVGQGGLLLLGPEYYTDPKLADIKAAYEAYIAKMLTMIKWPQPQDRAADIVRLETRIAEASWTREQMLSVVHTYNPITVPALTKLAPGFDWSAFLSGAGLSNVKNVVIDAPPAFPKIAHIFATAPVSVLQARQAFSVADNGAPRLNSAMVDANYEFRTKLLGGQSVVNNPRWVRAIREMQVSINDTLTKIYVSRYFSADTRSKAHIMAANLRRAMDARIQNLTWLSGPTKVQARAKLAKMQIEIGYPSKLQDYRGLQILPNDLYGNAARGTAYKWNRQVRRLNSPFDRSEWILEPDVANYNYVATTNRVEMPAASFQTPFFDAQADAAINYGAVGALMGSAIVGGFDDQGRRYDGDGRLRDWWTSQDAANFAGQIKLLSEQYSAIEPLPGVHVKGELAVAPAIGDLGGLLLALDAYHISLHGEPAPVLDGFTGDQRVFLGWAQLWRAKMRPAFVRMLLATGANPPPFLRVNGPVRNIDAWYQAFDVTSSDKLYLSPEKRVHLW